MCVRVKAGVNCGDCIERAVRIVSYKRKNSEKILFVQVVTSKGQYQSKLKILLPMQRAAFEIFFLIAGFPKLHFLF